MLGVLTVLVVVAVLVVLFVAAVVATHESDFLKDAPAATPDLGLPESAVQPEDVAEVRFGLTLRGYRMREVDEVLARLADELGARDKRITQLEQTLAGLAEEPRVEPKPTPAVAPYPLDDFPEVLPAEHVGRQLPEAASAEQPSPATDAEWRPFEPWSDHNPADLLANEAPDDRPAT